MFNILYIVLGLIGSITGFMCARYWHELAIHFGEHPEDIWPMAFFSPVLQVLTIVSFILILTRRYKRLNGLILILATVIGFIFAQNIWIIPGLFLANSGLLAYFITDELEE